MLQGCFEEPLNKNGSDLAVVIGRAMMGINFNLAFKFSGCPNGETVAKVCSRTQVFLKELAAVPRYQG